MGILELLILAVGLSMDAFAVSVCKGLSLKQTRFGHAVTVGAYFGVFQAGMPLVGYFLGNQFKDKITAIDHWIAFLLLAAIGLNMIRESKEKEEECREKEEVLSVREMLVLSVATSIDALAVGITFAFLRVKILPAASCIGLTAFFLSAAGVIIGSRFGAKYKSKAELFGGIILVFLGLKILAEHLEIFG